MKKILLCLVLVIGNLFTSCQYEKGSSQISGSDRTAKDSLNSFIKHTDGFYYTKLGISCKNNDFSNVKELISKGADINLAKKDEIYEYDALSVAIENRHLQIVHYLIAHKADVNVVYNEDGLTPLGLAAKQNAPEIVEILLINGADVNGAVVLNADYNENPLLIAVENDHRDVAKLLIRSGASLNGTDTRGTPIKNIILSKGEEWETLLADPHADQKASYALQSEYYADDSMTDGYGISLKFDKGSVVYTESGNMGRTYNQYALLEDKTEKDKIFLKYQQTLTGHTGDANKQDYFGVITVVNDSKLQFESPYLKSKFGTEKIWLTK